MMGSADSMGGGMMGGMASGPMRAKQVQRTVLETQYVPMSPEEAQEIQQYQEIVTTLRSDKPEAEKELARKQLSELLSVGFDRDLETRETDLKSLETRVQKLRAQLDKRKAAKQEIVDLRLKTIQNEADGLEYPGSATQPEGASNPLVPVPGF
jgi:polyhydroxyalkanoate synthesis regulator phasin